MEKKIFLVVDNDTDLINEVKAILSDAYDSCTIYHASEPREALAKARNVPPSVLLSGLELRRESGMDFLRSIFKEKLCSNTSLIVFSDPPEVDEFVDSIVKGKLQFLPLPVDRTTLLNAINKAFSGAASKEVQFDTYLLAPQELLFREGDKAESAFLLKSGKLRALRRKGNDTEVLGEILPGEFVGEMAHLNGEPRSADIEALENAELIVIPNGTLDAMLLTKPTWSKALLKTLSKRLNKLQRK